MLENLKIGCINTVDENIYSVVVDNIFYYFYYETKKLEKVLGYEEDYKKAIRGNKRKALIEYLTKEITEETTKSLYYN